MSEDENKAQPELIPAESTPADAPQPEASGSSPAPSCATWTLEQCGRALDEVAAQPTRYSMATAVRERFGVPLLATIATVVDGNEAATAALLTFEYHLTFTGHSPRRLTLEPRDEVMSDTIPPQIRDLPVTTIQLWRELLGVCTTSVMTARLHHLLFVRGGRDAREHALAASDDYADAAGSWDRDLDAVEDLSASLRLARSVGDQSRATAAMGRLLDAAEREIDGDDPKFGIAARAIEPVLDERDCPERVDDLLARAEASWPDSSRLDQILEMQLSRADTPASESAIWERRVEARMAAANAEESAMMRSVRLRQALALAEESGSRDLRRRAAAALAGVRGVLGEMVRFHASSRRYDEEFDRIIEDMSRGDDWHESLIRFASYPPVSGNVDVNRQLVRDHFAASPLSALMPSELYSPDGLPYLGGDREEAKFDIELTRIEMEHIGHLIRPLARALHVMLHDDPPPPYSILAESLNTWPGVGRNPGRLADILLRYWAGDSDGAAYLVFPVIERIVRELVEASGSGTYRLQRRQSPGQFPALGALLPLLTEEYRLDESRTRYLQTVLVHPAGANLRNLLAHGYIGEMTPPWTAVLIQCALMLATLELPDDAASEDADSSDGRQ